VTSLKSLQFLRGPSETPYVVSDFLNGRLISETHFGMERLRNELKTHPVAAVHRKVLLPVPGRGFVRR
jgi:hypothetical protein